MSVQRVAPLKPDELDARQQAFLKPFSDAKGRYPNIFGVLCRNMPLMEAWRAFGLYLMNGSRVDPVLREILILRTAHNRECEYEWSHHRRAAITAGLSEAQLDLIRIGGPTGNEEHDLMVRCADELSRGSRLSDDVWAAMMARFGLEYTLDAVFTVGAYTALSMGLNSCMVEVEGRMKRPGDA